VPTILVVDDEPDVREVVRVALELDGFHVTVAADGDDGLRQAFEGRPDLIILDVGLPGLDGWDVLRRLKATEGRNGVPVIMLTGCVADLDRVRGGIEGAIRYVTKPFDQRDLRGAVASVLNGGPEAAQRRIVQRAALVQLARLEGGDRAGRVGAPRGPQARPRLARLDGAPTTRAATRRAPPVRGRLESLSPKQQELIRAVGGVATVREAADRLQVSRSNVYASLRRIARKLGVANVSDLVSLARRGGLS